jgi:pyridoxal phosphate-dependent aminotransferase EpsN
MNNRIYLSPPHKSGQEKELFIEAFDSGWIAPLGPNVDAFEQEIADYLNMQNSCALSSGSAALHLALRILGIKEGDKVLCPSLTFVASANVILYENAIPVFVDVDSKYWTIDLISLEDAIKKYKPKAFIAVDLYGQSCDYDAISDLCDNYQVALIEDAAEALGSEYKQQKCGSFGKMGVLSFNGNKIITTSSGGMLVSDNEDYINKAQFLSTQARESCIHYEHKELGYNYRMSNLLAAVGRGQLQSLDNYVSKRRDIYKRYYDALSFVTGVEFMQQTPYGKSNRWLTTLTIDNKKTGINRNQIIEALEKENIESRPVWKPMHLQPFYKGYEYVKAGDEDISAKLFQNGLCLPSGSSLSEGDQDRIIDIILSLLQY